MVIPVGEGEWVISEDARPRTRFSRTPWLAYRTKTFPRLSLDLLKLQCVFGGGHRIHAKGLVPAQSFPQPRITFSIGAQSWAAIPNAIYSERSEPTGSSLPAGLPLDDNLKGKDLSWPGHPPYAELNFFRKAEPAMLEALRSGEPIRVEFEGQRRVFPAVPAEIAARYVGACGQLTPPLFSSE